MSPSMTVSSATSSRRRRRPQRQAVPPAPPNTNERDGGTGLRRVYQQRTDPQYKSTGTGVAEVPFGDAREGASSAHAVDLGSFE